MVKPHPLSLGLVRALEWLARYRHLIPLLSFGAGLASYLLVQRQEAFAQALVVLLPLGWLFAVLEPLLLPRLQMHVWLRHSPLLLRYVQQSLHQEALFFTLPFFLATTTWHSAQPVFVLTLGALALASIIDPIYIERVATRPALLWALHAYAAFATVLTAAPMLWQITTTTSLMWAIGAGATLSVPAFAYALRGPRTLRWSLAVVAALVLAALVAETRSLIPPATLRVYKAGLTTTIDIAARTPGPVLKQIDVTRLRAEGLYAWTPIHAPRGLAERIEHQWWHKGELVDRIPIEIRGGREQGYRAWTHKTAFGDDPRGDWQIRVVTQSDQLIGIVRITVR